MPRTNWVERLSRITGLNCETETTPIAAPFASTIGDPDIPQTKNSPGSNASQPPRRIKRPLCRRPLSESTRERPSPGAGFSTRRIPESEQLGALRRRVGHHQRCHTLKQPIIAVGLLGQILIVGLTEHGDVGDRTHFRHRPPAPNG
jgi:hypothetical protein